MAMFWIHKKLLVFLLIGLLHNFYEDAVLGKRKTTVSANGNVQISGPFLQIEKQPLAKLRITKPHVEHFLHCKANIDASFYEKNKPNLFYTWYRNDNVLQASCLRRNDFCIFDNGTLRLPSAEKSGGRYRCQVNANSVGVLSESITVEYPVLKRIIADGNTTAHIGETLTLNCPVQSVPPANITWHHDNNSLSNESTENRYIFLGNGSLVLISPTMLDAGKYRCVAQNQFATKSHRQFLWTMKVNPSDISLDGRRKTPQYAHLMPQLQESTLYVPLGHDLKLRCRSISDLVAIEWWYQRVPSAPVEKLSNYSSEYEIQSASVEQHDGYYTCSTSKDKQIFHVVVTTPPVIINSLPSYESHIAASVTLSCHAVGNPTPEISWYHNAAPVNSSFLRYITTNELRLISFDSDEEGIYQCFARNAAGEASTDGEIRLKSLNSLGQLIPNPLKNIRCFAHSSTTVNITFDRVSLPLYFLSVHIVQSHPHRWTAIAPLEPIDSSYVVISSHLPAYRPFELITRAMLHTSSSQSGSHNPNEEPVTSSLRSQPITCCTQGLPLQMIKLRTNDTFITWPQPPLKYKKYYILQFGSNTTRPHPERLFAQPTLRGTTAHVILKENDVTRNLNDVQALHESAADVILRRVDMRYAGNDSSGTPTGNVDEDIYNLVLPANVTGIILEKLTLLKMRVLIITAENEYLQQDFRYVQWKIIENETSETSNVPFHLTKVESRMVAFLFQESFKEQCIHVCYMQINNQEESMCVDRKIINSQLELRSLKPTSWYRLSFSSCRAKIFYGQKDFETLADPPGTISNQRITKHNGLKLSWDPPIHPNGRIHHYNILWTVHNVTHEANVFECSICFYKFPHVSETSKINITVRVVGENGIGAPIFIDLRTIDHQTLEVEHSSSSQVYSGIAIGAVLSALCVFFFALLIVFQRRRFKSRQQAPIHLTSQSETNFGNLSHTGIPCDSAGAISGSMLQHEYHEMQTLIPRSRSNIPFLNEHQRPLQEYETTPGQKLPTNGYVQRRQEHGSQELRNSSALSGVEVAFVNPRNLSHLPLCSSTPRPIGKLKEATGALKSGPKPYFIPFKQLPQGAGSTLQKHCSSPNFESSVPNSLTLDSPPNLSNGRRSGSLTNSSTNANNASTYKHFQTNFPKQSSSSNDGICLLSEDLTPTSETEVSTTDAVVSNGYRSSSQKSPQSSTTVNKNVPLSRIVTTTTNTNNIYNTNRNASAKTTASERQHSSSFTSASTVPTMILVAAAEPTTGLPTVPSTNSAAASAKRCVPTTFATNLYRRPNVDPNG